jgi:uncharacterized radical SAM superfamily Fe-S cluster-containing enzyme
MPEQPTLTQSLCPHCLRRIPARRVTEAGSTFLEKTCPEHGDLAKVLLWRNQPRSYHEWSRTNVIAGLPILPEPLPEHCPYGCRSCVGHGQNTCSAILEVTQDCDLRCPVCFAASGKGSSPDISTMSKC